MYVTTAAAARYGFLGSRHHQIGPVRVSGAPGGGCRKDGQITQALTQVRRVPIVRIGGTWAQRAQGLLTIFPAATNGQLLINRDSKS